MSGMTTTGTTDLSDYNSRTVEIEVTGLCRQDVMRTSNYKVKVPYSRMAQEVQRISRMGGKVAGVMMVSSSPSASPSASPSSEQ